MASRWVDNRLCKLLGTELPVMQGGMVHNSGAELAAAVSEAGGLGLIGAGSMRPEEFRQAITECRDLTRRPFGVNIPLLYGHARDCLEIALTAEVPVIVTSAGSPRKAAGRVKATGAVFIHVAASPTLARKCEEAGCDAVVVEGFEAGGHNGREELTTMVLTPLAVDAVSIPVIAAGGIATGAQMAAAFALGAKGVQVGSRFAMTKESSGHDAFKTAVVEGDDTKLVLKNHIPVRLLRNEFRERVEQAEADGADRTVLAKLLGEGRARLGMAEGDLAEGELEIGQVAAMIEDIPTVAEVVSRLLAGYDEAVNRLRSTP